MLLGTTISLQQYSALWKLLISPLQVTLS
jgi:hypothetical protein